ncbi:MAG: hypothetical protein QNJ36_12265 [Calothrix sp. MO_167.B42]|nr:hypothetical protein [Calothrix sp. MO_167.B42]
MYFETGSAKKYHVFVKSHLFIYGDSLGAYCLRPPASLNREESTNKFHLILGVQTHTTTSIDTFVLRQAIGCSPSGTQTRRNIG